ncbi:MAG: hypothetical protein QGH25_11515 [Candidatus Latescibacteria bacterium]|nr:hypothetical protein [Candidatus Latescibacterota bacterium]
MKRITPGYLAGRRRDDVCRAHSVAARTGTGAVPTALYCLAGDSMLPELDAIVLVGLLPSRYALATGTHPS